ncbi:MAG: riboflavin kinase [Bacteroidia bacterium]|jgi:riboflavin kinase/FMN adenylyltransferase
MSTKPISITLPEELLDQLNKQVESGQFASVSEFIRHSVRMALAAKQSGAQTAGQNTEDIDKASSHSWLTGKVQRGQQLGGKLGFPTLNLDPTLLPATVMHGVYAAQVEYGDHIYLAAAHFGPRKTLGEWKPMLEFYLLDFDQHIPGALVRFRLLERIRATLRFDSLDALKKQLADDVAKVRQLAKKTS